MVQPARRNINLKKREGKIKRIKHRTLGDISIERAGINLAIIRADLRSPPGPAFNLHRNERVSRTACTGDDPKAVRRDNGIVSSAKFQAPRGSD